MQIQAIQNSNNKLNFGMGVKISPEAQKYISDNFSERQLKNFLKLLIIKKQIHTTFIYQQILNW